MGKAQVQQRLEITLEDGCSFAFGKLCLRSIFVFVGLGKLALTRQVVKTTYSSIFFSFADPQFSYF